MRINKSHLINITQSLFVLELLELVKVKIKNRCVYLSVQYTSIKCLTTFSRCEATAICLHTFVLFCWAVSVAFLEVGFPDFVDRCQPLLGLTRQYFVQERFLFLDFFQSVCRSKFHFLYNSKFRNVWNFAKAIVLAYHEKNMVSTIVLYFWNSRYKLLTDRSYPIHPSRPLCIRSYIYIKVTK